MNSPEKFYLILGSVCALLYGGVEPAVGLIYSMIYGLLANPNLEIQSLQTRNLSLGIFGIYVFAGIVQFLSTVTFAKAGEALTLRMRLFTFEAMLRREISWFDDEKNSVGSLVTRLSNDTAALKVNSIYSSVFFCLFVINYFFEEFDRNSNECTIFIIGCCNFSTYRFIYGWLEINISCFMFYSIINSFRVFTRTNTIESRSI